MEGCINLWGLIINRARVGINGTEQYIAVMFNDEKPHSINNCNYMIGIDLISLVIND